MWPPTFLGVHSSYKRGRRRRCWMQGGGTVDGGGGRVWHAVEKKKANKITRARSETSCHLYRSAT